MGFINSADTLTVLAKLTTIGRQRLLLNSNSLISYFSLGDSDANYNVEYPLTTGELPVLAGDLTLSSGATNSMNNNFELRSKLIKGSITTTNLSSQNTKKLVESSSSNIVAEKKWLDYITISGDSLYQKIIDRTDVSGTGNTLSNLFKSFNLPITEADKNYFNTAPYPNGFKNTALSGINQDEVLIVSIPKENYGELIDGKSIKSTIDTTGGTYTLYSTYQKTLTNNATQDNNYIETSEDLKYRRNLDNPQLVGKNKFGNNISFLFSDDVAKPNQDPTNSWSTGYNTFKPFTLKNKKQFNLITNTNTSTTADTAVGIAYLDKGFIVITHPDIVSGFVDSGSTATTVSFKSLTTEVSQKVTCLIKRGEFGVSTNPTFEIGDVPRISEIALLDNTNAIIAVAKLDKHIQLSKDMFLAIGVKIVV